MPSRSTLAALTIPAVILLIPLIAMQFTDEVKWNVGDFILMYLLLAGVGFGFKLITRGFRTLSFRLGAAVGVGTAFLVTWVNLAVGIIGSEDNPLNALYFLVVGVGLLGAVLARFEPAGMARAAFAMAGAQLAVPALAFFLNRADFSPGVFQVIVLNAVFALMFATSGALLLFAAHRPGAGAPATATPA